MLLNFKRILGIVNEDDVTQPNELSHINQEVYKKSFELSERNKTLLLLRKIDEIILSSVTDQKEIAKQVTSILINEAGFQLASIFIYSKDEKLLTRLAHSETGQKTEDEGSANIFIPMSKTENVMVQSAIDRKIRIEKTLDNVLVESKNSQTEVKSVFVYPIIVRDDLIGCMVIALSEEEFDISEYTHDLLDRLVQVIGIAIDNASLYNQLQDANEKLKVLDKLKDEFVSLASHELRTPMTAIKSYLWMMLQKDAGPLNDTQKLYVERAYSSTDRLIKLVNDMLNISRIESGRITIQMQKVDIYKLTQEVIAEVLPRAQELGVNIVVSPAPSIPEVIADPDKIKEVMFNLIGNSLKFTPKSGVVTISFSQNGEYVETKISDTGSGISKDNISKLFQKFSMLSDSYKDNKTAWGTGLGLYICKSIVELHNGKIWVDSEGLGKGSQFTFSLKVFSQEEFSALNSDKNSVDTQAVGLVHTQI